MLVDLYSSRNVVNSVATYLAAQLLAAGYLVYWRDADAMQAPAGWYTSYSTQAATYLADPVFSAAFNAAKGIVTLVQGETAFASFVTRPTNDGTVGTQNQVQIPAFGITIGPDVVLKPYEAGSGLKWRVRALTVEGRAREKDELQAFSDALAKWFDDGDVYIDVVDHDGTSGEAPGAVRVTRRTVTRNVDPEAGAAEQFQVECMARLEYVA